MQGQSIQRGEGCSVDHLLVDLWDDILWNLKDDRAATLITGIDYAKAFNRLSFQHCLKAFARKGASTQTIALLATFLSNREMTVKVAQTRSSPRLVLEGVPQGSILGVLLFNITTDNLEDLDEHDARDFVDSDPGVSSSSSGHVPQEPVLLSSSSSSEWDDQPAPAQPMPSLSPG